MRRAPSTGATKRARRPVRGGGWRHLVPRRTRHPVDGGAGPAAARGGIWRDHPDRIVAAGAGRCPIVAATNEHLPDKVETGTNSAPTCSTGVLRGGDAAALRARAGDVVCWADHSGGAWRRNWLAALARLRPGRARPAERPSLARQRPRTAPRGGAGGLSLGAGRTGRFRSRSTPSPRPTRARRRRPRRGRSRRSTERAEPEPERARPPRARQRRRGGGVRGRAVRLQEPRRAVRARVAGPRPGGEPVQPAPDRRLAGLSYDQLRHALRRHDLIGTVA